MKYNGVWFVKKVICMVDIVIFRVSKISKSYVDDFFLEKNIMETIQMLCDAHLKGF